MIIADEAGDDLKDLTCSFGVACFQEGDQVSSLLKRADDSLYQAKAEGRNRVIANTCCDGAS